MGSIISYFYEDTVQKQPIKEYTLTKNTMNEYIPIGYDDTKEKYDLNDIIEFPKLKSKK